MLKNYFIVALRNLKKNKAFSSINILGFAFSIAVCMMIVLYLIKEYGFDSYHKNADSIYRLLDANDNYSSIDYRVKNAIIQNHPDVKNATVLEIIAQPIEANYKNNAFYIDNIMSTDNDFFKVFTVEFIKGNSGKPFENINSAILTESASRKMFGNEDPIGKEIVLHHKEHVFVTGVIKDFPDNSSLNANIIVNSENKNFKYELSMENSDDKSTYRYLFNIYLQLNKNISAGKVISEINNRAGLLAPYEKKIDLIPLKNLYLHDYTKGGEALKGNPSLLDLMATIAFIVLILAIINYVNLTAARQNKRNKETGIRKTIGAGRIDMIILFLAESITITTIAFFVALVILSFGLPFFNGIVNSSLSVQTFLSFPNNIIVILSILVIGFLAGIGPAILLSSFNPARLLNGGLVSQKSRSIFRNVLTVFQFTVSIGLIFCIVVIQKQISFVKNQNPGFDKEQLLRIDMPGIHESDKSKSSLLLDKFRQSPGIKNLSVTLGVPGSINWMMGSGIPGKDKHLSIIHADTSFLKTFGIKQLKGRTLLTGDIGNVCMLNEAAYNYFGWNDIVDKRYNNGKPGGYEVIGVVKDFNYASLHVPIEPMCIIFDLHYSAQVSLRIAKGAVGNSLEFIQNAWKEILPDYPLKYQFYDEWFDAMYRKEDQLAKTIGLFALLAISISCLGILGLAIFSSENRSKEIGIRKVHGAGIKDILLMLNLDYIKWVAVAFIIACPSAWYFMRGWLQDFAYRVEISWWMFILSGGIALLIALLTVSFHAVKAATANPVESLRYE